MHQQDFLNTIPPQKDVITLQEGMTRTNNWRETVKHIYGNDEHNIPRAVFIPFDDILELKKLRDIVPSLIIPPNTEPVPIYIVGVRAYFTLNNPVSSDPGSQNNSVDAILVAVYQLNTDGRDGDKAYAYNCNYDTFDLIIEVPKKQEDLIEPLCPAAKEKFKRTITGDEVYASIYDITRPCPNLCDASSDLH